MSADDDEPTRIHSPNERPTGSLPEPADTVAGDGAPSHQPPRRPPAGARYVLGAEIASGGMGVVYRATDTALGREVAVKVLQERFAPGSGTARRFADEARIAGQLQHPGIPPVHDIGTLPDGRPFLAMKLIKGDTLDVLLGDSSHPAPDRGRYVAAFEQVCHAVAYAHSRNVIHRDLKPANVMVGAFGEVQVMDWGLAKVMTARDEDATDADQTSAGTLVVSLRDADGAVTQTGSVLGTPAFMPPEQAIGAVGKIDARSDVFGLGAVLAVILTGEPPFASGSAETTRVKAAQGDVAECFARLDASGAEPELVDLCKWCLSPRAADRPANAGVVADAVADFRAAADERARQAELDRARAEARVAQQRKLRRVQAALGLAFLALVVGGGAFAWHSERQAETRKREEVDRAREQDAARATARQNLFAALDRASTAIREEQPAAASAALDRAGELQATADSPEQAERYKELRADLAAVVELNRVWAKASAVLHEQVPGASRRVNDVPRFDAEAARKGYPAAFAARGLEVESADPATLAERIGKSPARARLLDALDDWLPFARQQDRARLCDLLARLDPDPARTAVRRAHLDPNDIRKVLAAPPPEAMKVAARAAMVAPVADAPVGAVLRAAAAKYPNDFRILYAAGVRSDRVPAVGYLRAAVAMRPDNATAVYMLGTYLYPLNPDEGAAALLRSIELDPGLVSAYLNLADAIKIKADGSPAVAYFEREVARDARQPLAHFGLGMALRDTNPRRAAEAFTRSIELDGAFAPAHHYLGYVLPGSATDARIRCYRRAIELDPEFAFPHYNLANLLRAKGDLPGAAAEYRAALALFPAHAFSHYELGVTLARMGEPQKAAEAWLGAIKSDPRFLSAYRPLGMQLIQSGKASDAEKVFRECVRQFPEQPVGYDGLLLALAHQNDFVGAVGVFTGASLRGFAGWPAEDFQVFRYNAACSAAQAGAGLGKKPLPPGERSVYRGQALAWLQAELDYRRKQIGSSNAAERKRAESTLAHWFLDTDLDGVRPGSAKSALTEPERAAWEALWAEAVALVPVAMRPREVAPPPRPAKG